MTTVTASYKRTLSTLSGKYFYNHNNLQKHYHEEKPTQKHDSGSRHPVRHRIRTATDGAGAKDPHPWDGLLRERCVEP